MAFAIDQWLTTDKVLNASDNRVGLISNLYHELEERNMALLKESFGLKTIKGLTVDDLPF